MRLLYTILLLLTVGCTSNQPKLENSYEKADSIIQSSKVTLIRSDSVSRESEKIITEKINRTVARIEGLQEEARAAKLTVKTVVRVDTVYIESKKNFWGRTKTSTTVKSDSTETLDTTQN